jgi:hypothetical protein
MATTIKLPITITEKNGDTTTCNSIAEAETEMEPIDVENGEFVVTDATGRQLHVEVIIEPSSWVLRLPGDGGMKKVRINASD